VLFIESADVHVGGSSSADVILNRHREKCRERYSEHFFPGRKVGNRIQYVCPQMAAYVLATNYQKKPLSID